MQNGTFRSGLRIDYIFPNQRPKPLVQLGYQTEFPRRELHDGPEEQRLPDDNARGRRQPRSFVGFGEQHSRFYHKPSRLLRTEHDADARVGNASSDFEGV